MTIMMSAQELMRQLCGDDAPATSGGEAVFGVEGFADAIGAAVGKRISGASTTVKTSEMSAVEDAAQAGAPIESGTRMRFTGLVARSPGHTFFPWTFENTMYDVETTYTSNVGSFSSSVGSGSLAAVLSVLGWSMFGDSS